jgi:hypothetical protein
MVEHESGLLALSPPFVTAREVGDFHSKFPRTMIFTGFTPVTHLEGGVIIGKEKKKEPKGPLVIKSRLTHDKWRTLVAKTIKNVSARYRCGNGGPRASIYRTAQMQ